MYMFAVVTIGYECVCFLSPQSLLYKKVHEAQFRSHLANEMMMYHMKVCEEEVSRLLMRGLEPVHSLHPNFSQFTYTPRSLPDDTTPMVSEWASECQRNTLTVVLSFLLLIYLSVYLFLFLSSFLRES